MSLFGSMQLGSNALRADQIALQVVGQNIANANTPGYLREEVQLVPAPTQRVGGLLFGMGVDVQGIVQKVDSFLEERLRGAVSDTSSAQTQKGTYTQLEQLIGATGDTDVNTAMTAFFNSISNILNQPEDATVRDAAVLDGGTLAQTIRSLASQVSGVRNDLNGQVQQMAESINGLTGQIASLNVKIAAIQGGDTSGSDAVGLSDQRQVALTNLANLINIRVQDQGDGTVTVYTGGDYLVNEGVSRPVDVVNESNRGQPAAYLDIAGINARLDPSGGQLQGLLTSRDDVLGGFLDQLNSFAGTLANEFNKVYSSGQGLTGYTDLTSQSGVSDASAPLDAAGLAFTPTNGSFQVLVHDKGANATHTTEVQVKLDGSGVDKKTTLSDLAGQFNQIDGLSAEVTSDGKLTIHSTSAADEFSFANDTSGVLAAMGINTFFTGSNANDLNVNPVLTADPAKFAASQGGIGMDTANAVQLAAFPDQAIPSQNGASISTIYSEMVDQATQGSSGVQAAADAANAFQQTLQGQEQAVSGVSIDEEAIQMITFQQSFQAAARYITTLSNMLDTLVKM
jgi:flagellar hook-associated protein 1 FlgK